MEERGQLHALPGLPPEKSSVHNEEVGWEVEPIWTRKGRMLSRTLKTIFCSPVCSLVDTVICRLLGAVGRVVME
jgi:hypothetical protein